ncbi:MAG: DUF5924 family protein [Polyangiales bacterium]
MSDRGAERRGDWSQLRDALFDRAKAVLSRYGRVLWWLHSVYALVLGTSVILFAQQGFAHARWLAVSAVGAWMLVALLFRVFGTQEADKTRIHRFVMTYVLKNLYQGMLFFLLPFYFKSATFGAQNFVFVVLLAGCAIVSTLDVVFDGFVMRHRILGSVFHGFTLFASMNLLVPAMLSNVRALYALITAAGITVLAFWTLHVPARAFLRNVTFVALAASLAAGMGLAWLGRALVPPVPMYLASAAVGPIVLPDGRLVMEVKSLHVSAFRQLVAVTDVAVPGGTGDELHHVWRHAGAEIQPNGSSRTIRSPSRSLRLTSLIGAEKLPVKVAGEWTVDIETRDGQLVGRMSFHVTE